MEDWKREHHISLCPETSGYVYQIYVDANKDNKEEIIEDLYNAAVAATLFEYADSFGRFIYPERLPEHVNLKEDNETDIIRIKNTTDYYMADMRELYAGELVYELSEEFFIKKNDEYKNDDLETILNKFLDFAKSYYIDWKENILKDEEKYINLLKYEHAAFKTFSKKYMPKIDKL